MENISGSGN